MYYKLKDILTFTEASTIWKLDSSTLRKLVLTPKIKLDIDYRKSGSVYLITKVAMIRIYGDREG